MNKIRREIFIFTFGAAVYPLLEILGRGKTHWSMCIAGGLCFLSICVVNHIFTKRSTIIKCAACALSITVIEFIVGYFVNRLMHWNVWNYSDLPLNILGQVCFPFTMLWFFLSLPALKIGEYIERYFDNKSAKKT
jgi:uncharacterized membrane protein